MADVNPAEVSAILKNQLAGFEAVASLNEVGTVLEVGDGIARVHGLTHAEYGELVTFENGMDGMVLNLEEDNVGVVLLGPSKEIKEGNTVKPVFGPTKNRRVWRGYEQKGHEPI